MEGLVKEVEFMSNLKGHSNIVSYEDHLIKEKKNEIGWILYIRMELLTSLFDHLKKIKMKTGDIIKLGIDICYALEVCQKYKIVHRDIKPENIFFSEIGNYKLGDFGVARYLEKTSLGLSIGGTKLYMAPEVYNGQAYNSTVDIYSLGIVLYLLLNNNRLPFSSLVTKEIKTSDIENANDMRLKGEPLPRPCNANDELAKIVLKACSYNSKERYKNPNEMRQALQNVKEKLKKEGVGYTSDSNYVKSQKEDAKKLKVEISENESDFGYCYSQEKLSENEIVKSCLRATEQKKIYTINHVLEDSEEKKRLLCEIQKGNARAQFKLGSCYYYGKDGFERNLEQAVIWFQQAAERGNAEAQYSLGTCYKAGRGVIKDAEEAEKWYWEAAKQGHVDAQSGLRIYYYNNILCTEYLEKLKNAYKKDDWLIYKYIYFMYYTHHHPKTAAGMCMASLKVKDASASNFLGICYYKGYGIEKNENEAISWFREAAELGSGISRCGRGIRFFFNSDWAGRLKGKITILNYNKLAKRGDAEAQYKLGICYYNGHEVAINRSEAVKWFRKAAENGNGQAQYILGCCYESGYGTSVNKNEAVKWFHKAAEQGDSCAQSFLGICYYWGIEVSKDQSEAVKWFRKAAIGGNSIAQCNLGDCYIQGDGVTKDKKEAEKWYWKAAKQGHTNARLNLYRLIF